MEKIAYHYKTDFSLENESLYTDWIIQFINRCGSLAGTLHFIFLSDEDLLEINQKYLRHDYYTDIITFEYEELADVSGDLFISVDRVSENSKTEQVEMLEELRRVMVHGVLHLLGFNDKTEAGIAEMRRKENEALQLFHVKHTPNV